MANTETMPAVVDLVGVHEISEMFDITKASVSNRRRSPDFPRPLAVLRCGPIWARQQILDYAIRRVERLGSYEQDGVKRLARQSATPSSERG